MLGFGGNSAADKAAEQAAEYGRQALALGKEHYDTTRTDYQPWIGGGLDSFNKGRLASQQLLNQNLDLGNAYQSDASGMRGLYNQYADQMSRPERQYSDMAVPTGPDYENAQNSQLYKTLMQNSQDAINNNAVGNGMSLRGSGAALDLARAANKNTQDVANQIYQNDMNNYQANTERNRFREGQDINSLLRNDARMGNIFQQGMGLEQLANQYGQQNWLNRRGDITDTYNANNQNLMNYLAQQQAYGKMGQDAQNYMSNFTGDAINSQMGTLSGLAENALKQAAAQGNGGGLMGSLLSLGGGALGSMMGPMGGMAGKAIGTKLGGMLFDSSDQGSKYDFAKGES